jgi:hypothetical protein
VVRLRWKLPRLHCGLGDSPGILDTRANAVVESKTHLTSPVHILPTTSVDHAGPYSPQIQGKEGIIVLVEEMAYRLTKTYRCPLGNVTVFSYKNKPSFYAQYSKSLQYFPVLLFYFL